MFDSKNIAVIAIICIIGIGGQYAFGGNIPLFGMNLNSNEIQENNQAISYMENIQ